MVRYCGPALRHDEKRQRTVQGQAEPLAAAAADEPADDGEDPQPQAWGPSAGRAR